MQVKLPSTLRTAVHRAGQLAVDAALVALAYWLAFIFRFDGNIPKAFERLLIASLVPVVIVKLAVFAFARLYQRWWRFTSIRDLQVILTAVLVATLVVTVLLTQFKFGTARRAPIGVLGFDAIATLFLVGGARIATRSIFERPGLVPRGREVLICGAGSAANLLLREMTTNRSLGYSPVGLIDDDERKRRVRVQGIRVVGARADLRRILNETQVDEVIIAMPSAPGRVRQEIVDICRKAGVPVKTLPSLAEMISEQVAVRQLREVRVEDVLGREPVRVDMAKVARYLNGKSVLVTGAGGSIGRELCRQLVAVGPRRLVMVDHAENNLFEIDLELRDRGQSNLVPVIADCRDEVVMRRVFTEHRPEIVFHAAAYKHVPMMELNPMQAVANNALATALLARLAEQFRVDRFCLISTDKAVEPKTIMGASKAIAERVIESRSGHSRTRFAAVRFGNVLGSSGSVLPIFQRQIAAGGPVTVTHAEMTRYFMTIPEAVQLVIEATGIAEGGDIFVLDMGEAVRIIDLAQNMIRLSGREPGRDIRIEVVGIRPGEKLHEELFNVDEQLTPTRFGKVMRATRPHLPADAFARGLEELGKAVEAGDADRVDHALWATLRTGDMPVDTAAHTP